MLDSSKQKDIWNKFAQLEKQLDALKSDFDTKVVRPEFCRHLVRLQ